MTAFHLLIMSTFLSAQSYYLSSNLWTFDEGSQFCQNHCNSELASIRNIIDVQQAADTINSAPILFTTETLFYIGLYSPQSSSIWSWTDSSSSAFDRWDSDQPDLPNNAKRCVVLDGSSSYFWNDVDCTTKRMALCNDCNGILNKYFIGASTNALWTDANTECSNTVPSSTLASMHFARDYEEMKDLCSIYTTHRAVDSEQNCWIGLYDPVPDDLFVDPAYLDGTTLDYGSPTDHIHGVMANPRKEMLVMNTRYGWKVGGILCCMMRGTMEITEIQNQYALCHRYYVILMQVVN
eukprot:1169070_1